MYQIRKKITQNDVNLSQEYNPSTEKYAIRAIGNNEQEYEDEVQGNEKIEKFFKETQQKDSLFTVKESHLDNIFDFCFDDDEFCLESIMRMRMQWEEPEKRIDEKEK